MDKFDFAQLLGELNAIRVCFDPNREPLVEMPQGAVGAARECPIAMALANGWEPTVDGMSVCMTWEKSALPKEKWIEIATRLTELECLRSKEISIQTEAGDELWSKLYGLDAYEEWEENDEPNFIHFYCTNLMADFVARFDGDEFQELIKGRNGNSVL